MAEVSESGHLWHPAVALRRMGEDSELLSSIVDYFLEDFPNLLQGLTERIDASDAEEACRLAHSLKGLCSNFDAEAATQAGAVLEAACADENFEEASELISPLTEQLRQLTLVLRAWKESNSNLAA